MAAGAAAGRVGQGEEDGQENEQIGSLMQHVDVVPKNIVKVCSSTFAASLAELGAQAVKLGPVIAEHAEST
jgi:hypothetical protein